MNTAYTYQSLEKSSRQIRLVVLLPSNDSSAPIKVKLRTATFPTTNEKYEALSYTWGDSSPSRTILEERGVMKVGQDLYDALCHLRQANQPRTLWIDALSINQSDVKEKNHQVSQMRDIFSSASKVLVWLGKSDDDTSSAMSFFWLPLETRLKIEKPMLGLLKLYRHPWWSRMWVVQEVLLAHEDPVVCCGDERAPWEAVTTTLIQMSWSVIGLNKAFWVLGDPKSHLIFGLSRIKDNLEQKQSLEKLLQATANRKATIPHDHVYALFGIVYDATERHLHPEIDYSLSEYVVFQNAMVTVFNSRHDLDWLLLAARGASGLRLQGAPPSWCIDFSAKDWLSESSDKGWLVTAAEIRRRNQSGREYGATAGREMSSFIHDRVSGIIKICGTRVGLVKVSHVATTGDLRAVKDSGREALGVDFAGILKTDTSNLIRDIVSFINSWESALESRVGQDNLVKKFASGDIWKIASSGKTFQSLVIKDNKQDANQFSSRADGFTLLEKFTNKIHPLWPVMTHKWKNHLPDEPEGFKVTAMECYMKIAIDTTGKCYFTLDTGYIGIAGHKVEEGDVVCILFGCKLPAVLRPQPDGSFTLVTFAYTDDIMDGEFLAEGSSIIEETFMLR